MEHLRAARSSLHSLCALLRQISLTNPSPKYAMRFSGGRATEVPVEACLQVTQMLGDGVKSPRVVGTSFRCA